MDTFASRIKNNYEKTEFAIYKMDRESDRFVVHFQFSIFNFQWLRAVRKPGRMLGKSVGIKLFH